MNRPSHFVATGLLLAAGIAVGSPSFGCRAVG